VERGAFFHRTGARKVFEIARKEFSDKELVDLTMAVIAINGWNRLAISFRAVAGSYQPAVSQQGAKGA
jgi:alkylhydroperoxidase family enzyme